ncbi:MAG TPA: ATP-binding protein [Candidatus Aquicultor sp.]|jgi:hypothetical protein
MSIKTSFLKRFEAPVTGLERNLFKQARLRLTLFYVAVIAVVLIVVSVVLYYSFSQDIQDEVNGEFSNEQAQTDFVARTITGLQSKIFVIDGAVIILVAGLGFWLAGKTMQPIQKTLAAQKRFVADASHELRTPLTIMKANLEVAMRGTASKGKSDAVLASNLEEVDRMNKIVEDLLVLSRIDNNQEQLQYSRIELSSLVVQSVETICKYAETKDTVIRNEIESPVYISGDHLKLEQAFLNILKNAIDYSGENGEVLIRAKQAGNQIQIAIQDNGIGIAPEDLPYVFDRFYRADKSRSRKLGGSGLGLSIVKWIIEQHRGTISAQSTPGIGTILTISLPLLTSS